MSKRRSHSEDAELGAPTDAPAALTPNRVIAAAFAELAERLTIAGESPFKLRSYARASETFAHSVRSIALLARAGSLRDIDGVGVAIAQKTQELCQHGTFAALEDARAQVPDGLVQLARIRGVSAKAARAAWELLGAQQWADVAAALDDGRLASVPGIGPKAMSAIRAAVAQDHETSAGSERAETQRGVLRHNALATLREALRLADVAALGAPLAPIDSVQRGNPARGTESGAVWGEGGDLARGTELPACACGWLARDAAEHAADEICSALRGAGWEHVAREAVWPQQPARGGQIYAICATAPNDVPLELYVGEPNDAGRLRLTAVGPSAFSAAIIARGDRGASARDPSEPDASARDLWGRPAIDLPMFEQAGVAWQPDELRERCDVAALAAQTGATPRPTGDGRLVELADLQCELHCHSTWSDGHESIIEMAQAALERGNTCIAITDHSAPYALVNGLDADRLAQQRDEIRAAEAELGGAIRILQGTELEIRPDGQLGLDDETLAQLDWVVASLHQSQRQDAEKVRARMLPALENPYVDAIGHPTSRLLNGRPPTALDVSWLISAAARTGTALELNANPRRLDLDSDNVRAAIAAGVSITINTDAHHAPMLDMRQHGVAVARRAGARPTDILNCLDVEALLARRSARIAAQRG